MKVWKSPPHWAANAGVAHVIGANVRIRRNAASGRRIMIASVLLIALQSCHDRCVQTTTANPHDGRCDKRRTGRILGRWLSDRRRSCLRCKCPTALPESRYDLYFRAGRSIGFYFHNDNHGVTLTAERINWTFDGQDDGAPFKNIRSVHLQTGGDWRDPVHTCLITFADGYQLVVINADGYGAGTDEARRPVYREFVRDLHARLAARRRRRPASPPACKGVRYPLIIVLSVLIGAVSIVVPVVAMILSGSIGPIATLFAGVGLYWPLMKMIEKNAPRSYDPRRSAARSCWGRSLPAKPSLRGAKRRSNPARALARHQKTAGACRAYHAFLCALRAQLDCFASLAMTSLFNCQTAQRVRLQTRHPPSLVELRRAKSPLFLVRPGAAGRLLSSDPQKGRAERLGENPRPRRPHVLACGHPYAVSRRHTDKEWSSVS